MSNAVRRSRILFICGLIAVLLGGLLDRAVAQGNLGRIELGTAGRSFQPRSNPSYGGRNLGTFDLDAYRRQRLGNNNFSPRLTQPQYNFNTQPRYNNFNNQPQYNYSTPQRNIQPNVVRSQPQATVRSNVVPSELQPRNNIKPTSLELEAIDAESHQLAGEMVQQQADKSIKDFPIGLLIAFCKE